MEKYRIWLCFCADFYAGTGELDGYMEEPDEKQCHRMSGCGWFREEVGS